MADRPPDLAQETNSVAVPELHVEIRKPDTGKIPNFVPAVLLHGWASDPLYWEPLAKELVEQGYEVWIFSLPGYHRGDTLPIGFEWNLDTASSAVAVAIRSRTARPVNLVGHSLGGSVALTVAANHPDVVASLTLVGMVPAPPNKNFRSMLLAQLEQGFIDQATRDRCMDAWYGPLPAEERELLSRGFNVPFNVLAPSGLAGMESVPAEVPSRIATPMLVVVGTGDKVRTPAQVEAFVSAKPERRLAAIPDAGHSVHWEQPAACAAAMNKFWSEPGLSPRKMSDI